MSYQDKYLKYKAKYIALKLNITKSNQSQKELHGGILECKQQNNTNNPEVIPFKQNTNKSDGFLPFKQNTNNTTVILPFTENGSNILYDELLQFKRDFSTDNHEVVIEYSFLRNIKKYMVDENNIINFYITTPSYYIMSIHNNTLNIAGTSIYLLDKYNDESNTQKIHDIIKNPIFAKHIIDIPFSKDVNGVKLTDITNILNLNNIDKTKIGIIIELSNDKILTTSKYNMIDFDDNEYYDIYDFDESLLYL
jgi:hypothetical protein